MHGFPVYNVPIPSFFLEVGHVTRGIERRFPKLTMLLRCSSFERHFECSEVLRVGFVSAVEWEEKGWVLVRSKEKPGVVLEYVEWYALFVVPDKDEDSVGFHDRSDFFLQTSKSFKSSTLSARVPDSPTTKLKTHDGRIIIRMSPMPSLSHNNQIRPLPLFPLFPQPLL